MVFLSHDPEGQKKITSISFQNTCQSIIQDLPMYIPSLGPQNYKINLYRAGNIFFSKRVFLLFYACIKFSLCTFQLWGLERLKNTEKKSPLWICSHQVHYYFCVEKKLRRRSSTYLVKIQRQAQAFESFFFQQTPEETFSWGLIHWSRCYAYCVRCVDFD